MMEFFTLAEFDSPDSIGSGAGMDWTMLQMLDAARRLYGRPMIVNSGFRTPAHNAEVGGKISSSHLTGLAVDIRCNSSSDRYDMIIAFMRVGFTRMGIGESFIHVDVDSGKPSNVVWTY